MWSSDFISLFFIKDKHIDAHSKKKKKVVETGPLGIKDGGTCPHLIEKWFPAVWRQWIPVSH